MLPQAALALTCMWSGLVAIALTRPKLRNDLLRTDGLALPAALFAAVILVAFWSLTPFVPGGPHPVWKYLGISPGAATIDKSQTLLEIFKLLGLGVVFTAGAFTGRSDERARTAINVILAIGAAYAAWTFLAFVAERRAGDRLEATVQSANTAGTIFAGLFLLSIGPLMSRLRSEDPRRLTAAAPYGTAALVFLVCLFTTASQGAFLSALCGLLAVGLLNVLGSRLRLSRAVLIGGITLIVVTGLLALTGDLLLNRLFGAHETVASRADIADTHWRAFQTSPLMGFGLGTFDAVNRTLLDNADLLTLWNVRAVHNVYLGWLEQAGLFGALPMFACIAALVLTTARKGLRRTRSVNLIFALLAVDVVFMIHGVSDFALEMFGVAALWSYLLGLQFSLSHGSSSR
jgi:O-antigen ligase